VSYFNIKRSGENQIGVPKYSAYILGEHARLSHDARCKQSYGWQLMFSAFSDQNSYTKYFISSYNLEDMNFTKYRHFLEKQDRRETFLTEGKRGRVTDARIWVLLTRH
jgi:hypothetical protein